jgi:hypothetical protein
MSAQSAPEIVNLTTEIPESDSESNSEYVPSTPASGREDGEFSENEHGGAASSSADEVYYKPQPSKHPTHRYNRCLTNSLEKRHCQDRTATMS